MEAPKAAVGSSDGVTRGDAGAAAPVQGVPSIPCVRGSGSVWAKTGICVADRETTQPCLELILAWSQYP